MTTENYILRSSWKNKQKKKNRTN